jgi:hypothetical protein
MGHSGGGVQVNRDLPGRRSCFHKGALWVTEEGICDLTMRQQLQLAGGGG